MGFWPRRRNRFELGHPSDTNFIPFRERPPEATAERPALAIGPAAEDERNVDPTPHRDVGSQARRNRSDGERRAASNPDWLPRRGPRGLTAGQCDNRVGAEANCGTGGRAFEQRGVLVIAHDSIRHVGGEPVGRPT
jgi:hypothetical protein